MASALIISELHHTTLTNTDFRRKKHFLFATNKTQNVNNYVQRELTTKESNEHEYRFGFRFNDCRRVSSTLLFDDILRRTDIHVKHFTLYNSLHSTSLKYQSKQKKNVSVHNQDDTQRATHFILRWHACAHFQPF